MEVSLAWDKDREQGKTASLGLSKRNKIHMPALLKLTKLHVMSSVEPEKMCTNEKFYLMTLRDGGRQILDKVGLVIFLCFLS